MTPAPATPEHLSPPASVQKRFRGRRGLTLVELLMALAIMSLIATTVAGMLSAMAYGTDTDRDVRKLVARNKMVSSRLNAAVRGGRMILAAGSDADGDWAVLWHRDLDGNDEPSLLEIRRLDFDAAAQTLTSYTAPEGTADVTYSTGDDFEAVTDALMGTADLPAELWANGVAGLSLTLDNADAQLSRTLSYRLSLTAGEMTDVTVGTVLLRN